MFPVACCPKSQKPLSVPFVGALDGYTANGVDFWAVGRRLLASYTGDCIRVRRSSDDTLAWIPYTADGVLDDVALAAHLGGSDGFCHTLPGQLNGHDLSQSSAAAQPQLAQDGNGEWYLYAPGAGFSTTFLERTGLSIANTDSSLWAVAASAGYLLSTPTTRDNGAVKERGVSNFGSSMNAFIQDNASGTVAGIGSTNNDIYSWVMTIGSGGNRLTNRVTVATGTRVPDARTINEIYMGKSGGGPQWSQNSKVYAQALWGADIGSTQADALAELGRTLLNAQ